MNPTIVVLRGPGGLLARPDAPNTGIWKDSGWRGVIWDGTDANDSRYRWTMTKPDSLFAFTPTNDGNGGWLGADATSHSTGLGVQFYVTKADPSLRGAYESWAVYEGNVTVSLVAEVEYSNDQGKYPSCGFAVEIVQ